jgi:hypothetical protein
MTTPHKATLREIADRLAAQQPALSAQLYADADYFVQLRKASTDVDEADDEPDDERLRH